MIGPLLLALALLSPETTPSAPVFPWTSFRAIALESPAGEVARCDSKNDRTRITELVIRRAQDFYRVWAMLQEPHWIAVHYDEEGRPDWVWRGTWAGDVLTVTAVLPYDPYEHASACEMLFGS